MEDEIITQMDKIFYTALLAKQPEIREKEAEDLLEKFLDEGGDLQDIVNPLAEQIANFMQSQNGKKKKEVKMIEL